MSLCEHRCQVSHGLDQEDAVSHRWVADAKSGYRLGILEVRLKCALLALKTLKAGIWGVTQWPGEEEDGAL